MGKNNKHGLKWHRDTYWQTMGYNQRLYVMLENQITSMALNRYKWVNLPATMDGRFLELTLFNQGMATLAQNPEDKIWYSLQVGGEQLAPDHYGYPSLWTALGVNGQLRFQVTKANGIYVYDNTLRVPIIERISLWVREIVDIIRTMQQNRAHMKVPVIISGLQDKKLDMTNYVKQIAGGEAFIIATDGISNMNVQAQKTDVPSYQSDLWSSLFNVLNMIYGALGIGNLPFKAERRIEDEVESQSEPTSLIALDGLEQRRRACRFLNQHFPASFPEPLNVVWNHDITSTNYDLIHNLRKMVELGDNIGGEENAGNPGIPAIPAGADTME